MRLNIVKRSPWEIYIDTLRRFSLLDFVLFCVITVIKYGIGIQEGSSQAIQLQDFS